MTDVERLLAAELADLGERAPHDPDLAGSVRRRARRRTAVAGAAAAVVVLAGGTALAAAGPPGRDGAPVGAPPPEQVVATCPPPESGPLPEWARTGFSSPDPGIPFVRSASGDTVAILFGPLSAPPDPDRANKILWVSRAAGSGTFRLDARLAGSDLRVARDLGAAPGPSGVDLPAAGCWRVELHWGPYVDSIELRYTAG